MQKRVLSLAVTALLLAACGGGNSDNPDRIPDEQASTLLPGETFTTVLSADDLLLERTEYRLYATSKDGQLVTTTSNLISDNRLIPLRVARFVLVPGSSNTSAVTPEGELLAFFPQLWKALADHHKLSNADEVAKQVFDLDISLERIYQSYLASGLTLPAFVDFYEALDEHPQLVHMEATEAQLSNFLDITGASPSNILSALRTLNISWRDFLRAMVAHGENFSHVYEQYQRSSGISLPAFLSAYMQKPAGSMLQGGFNDGMAVNKYVWDLIHDNKVSTWEDGAFTSVLSTADNNPANYLNPALIQSSTVELKATGKSPEIILFKTSFTLTGYNDANHPLATGRWLPRVNMEVRETYSVFNWNLNAQVLVGQPYNVSSSANATIPEVPLYLTLNKSGLLENFDDNYTFLANGADGVAFVGY